MKNKETLFIDKVRLLEHYSAIEGTEVGELWNCLISLYNHSYLLSSNCADIIREEINKEYENAIDNYKLIVEKDTCFGQEVERKRLEYVG